MFRGLGWAANNGGGHFEANTSASASFIRSTDDLIKVRDGDITTENMVLWQSYNGGTFQLGWAGLRLVNISHRAASVIENEWRAPDTWEKYDTRPNNAVVSLVDVKSTDPAEARLLLRNLKARHWESFIISFLARCNLHCHSLEVLQINGLGTLPDL